MSDLQRVCLDDTSGCVSHVPSAVRELGYFALVLDHASRELLRHRFASLPSTLCDHCTVAWGTDRVQDLPPAFAAEDLGRVFRLKVTGYRRRDDQGIEAVVVALDVGDGADSACQFSNNAVAHVTVATDGRAAAVEANALLECAFDEVDGPWLSAKLCYCPSDVTAGGDRAAGGSDRQSPSASDGSGDQISGGTVHA